MGIAEIGPKELQARLASAEPPLLIDVREQWEYDVANLPAARLIPLGQLESRLAELEAYRDRPVVVHCRTGGRSGKACEFLRSKGFTRVENLRGGIDLWSREVDPSVPRY